MRRWIVAIVSGCLLCGALTLAAQREVIAPVDPVKARIAPPPESRVDINRASLDELMRAPGMTRGWAMRIVRYRPYRTKLDLYLDGVVPGAVYERIRYGIIAHRVSAEEAAGQPAARRELTASRAGSGTRAGE